MALVSGKHVGVFSMLKVIVKGLVNFLKMLLTLVKFFLGGTRVNMFIGRGGTNRSDKGLNLSGSWQQGHSAAYNTPSRI